MDVKEKNIDYNTIGGWLMVLQVFIILNGVSWLRTLQLFYGLLGEKDKLINEMHVADPSLYTSFVYFEIAAALIMLLFTGVLVYFMFRRAKLFKIFMIVYVTAEILLEIAVILIYGSLMQAQGGGLPMEKLIFTAVIAGLITYYILRSERVRLTFIN